MYLGRRKAAEHAFEAIEGYLENELKLQVNRDKSAVARASTRDFLGYGLIGRGTARLKVAAASVARLRQTGVGRLGRVAQTQATVSPLALRQAFGRPGQDADEAGTARRARVALGDQRARCLVERRGQPHERGLPEVLIRPHGARVAGGYSPALPASLMNRRMRNRTYGGVRGRRRQLRPLLDVGKCDQY